MVREGIRALLLGNDTPFFLYRSRIAELAARHAIPVMYPLRLYVVDGGLMSYGADATESIRQQDNYVGRILRGEKAADLPVPLRKRSERVSAEVRRSSMGFPKNPSGCTNGPIVDCGHEPRERKLFARP
jgi:putative ABC transport system substrate-binding protein